MGKPHKNKFHKKKIILSVLIPFSIVLLAGGGFCVYWFAIRKQDHSIQLTTSSESISPNGDRSVKLAVKCKNVPPNNVQVVIQSENEDNWQQYFEPIKMDWNTYTTLQLKESVVSIETDFRLNIRCNYQKISSNSVAIDVTNGIQLSTLFDVTSFKYGDFTPSTRPPPNSVLHYAVSTDSNPKLIEKKFTVDDFCLIVNIENGFKFNVPNKVDGIYYFGDISLTYDISDKPTLQDVVPSVDRDLSDAVTHQPHHWDYQPGIEDIAYSFQYKFGGNDGNEWYTHYRYIFWTDLIIENYNLSANSITIKTKGEQNRYVSDSTLTFTGISWGGV